MLDIRKLSLVGLLLVGGGVLYADSIVRKHKTTLVKKVYKHPKVGRYPLDYCRYLGQNCGQDAADDYCKRAGWSLGAKSFHVVRDTPPTTTIGDGKYCKHEGCDKIVDLVCIKRKVLKPVVIPPKKLVKRKTYKNPKVGRYALDYCREFGQNCGQPAANAYCKQHGWDYAKAYKINRDLPPTKTIGDRKICTHEGCDKLTDVTCAKR